MIREHQPTLAMRMKPWKQDTGGWLVQVTPPGMETSVVSENDSAVPFFFTPWSDTLDGVVKVSAHTGEQRRKSDVPNIKNEHSVDQYGADGIQKYVKTEPTE